MNVELKQQIPESKNEIKNKLEKDGNKILIDKYVDYMAGVKEKTNLENKLTYLRMIWKEINKDVLDIELASEKIFDKKLKDEILAKEVNELEKRFFDLLRERKIINEDGELLKINKN